MPTVLAVTRPGSEPPKPSIPAYLVARPGAVFPASLTGAGLGTRARQGGFWHVDPGALMPSELAQ